MSNCTHCNKPAPEYHNYCGFNCRVENAKAIGGKVITPNGLPIRCITANGDMLEHEHGDHPDYKYPVEVNYVGPVTANDREDFAITFGCEARTDDEVREYRGETHALIYRDRSIAITMYECCYAMWHLRDGSCLGGSLWQNHGYKLDLESMKGPNAKG